MTTPDEAAAGRSRGILDWLGFGRPLVDDEAEPFADPEEAAEQSAEDLRERRRRQLLADMGSFLCSHRLEVNPTTLSFAHDVITGADQTLAALIEERVAQRQPITAKWIEEFARGGGRYEDAASLVTSLMTRFQGTIVEFSETTRAACTATNAYNSALSAHVDDLDKAAGETPLLGDLTRLARFMLDRTRELECAMEHSETHTRALRRDLEKARHEAACDHLTGLPNRRTFEAVLAREYALAMKTGEPLCVAFCDVDNFKRVNDTHGHEAGDRVLREIAQTLASISDDHCHVARHGGEEFVVLIRGRTIDEAVKLINGAREDMAARRLVNRVNDLPFGRVTFSAGVADVLAAADPREALRLADTALLLAKTRGRNRVCREASIGPSAAVA